MATVLLVHPEEAVRRALGEMLAGFGHDVTFAAGADRARDALRARPYELVLVAPVLPGENGLRLIPTLAELADWAPVVVVADAGDPLLDHAEDCGAAGVLLLPPRRSCRAGSATSTLDDPKPIFTTGSPTPAYPEVVMSRLPRGRATRAQAGAIVLVAGLAACTGGGSDAPPPASAAPGTHADLVQLFQEWREFERPAFVDGVPDYTSAAMAAQYAELPSWQARLRGLQPSGWSVPEQVDWHLVRAEMNGLDFDHRVRRPWARDPAFYVSIYAAESDVPAHEGPVIHGWIDTWTYDYPLSAGDASELAERIGAIPTLLDQARQNLTGDAQDLWAAGFRSFAGQSRDLEALAEQVAGTSAALDQAIADARAATDEFLEWLRAEAPSKTGPSGVGKDNYTWYMRNVHLVPYSWEELVTLMRRELVRSHSSLRLEENRNRHLPQLQRIASPEEYDRRLNEAVTDYMAFLEAEEIHEIHDWMDPALRAVNGSFTPAAPDEIRNFFSEVTYRDPLAMRTHMHHWIELARMREDPHPSPIRAVPSLYNIFDHRSEGLATAVEEMFMHAGLFDARPRTRELIWIMVAQRAARALSGLYLHGNEFTMEEAVQHATDWTPRGWLPDGDLVRNEQHLYLRQPGYGTSYLSGKIQLEELMAERAIQLGDGFTVGRFFDEVFDTGVIPLSLTRWEMTGTRPDILDLEGSGSRVSGPGS